MHRVLTGIILASLTLATGEPLFRVQTIAGSSFSGDGGPATQALLVQAEGVAVSPNGTLYIADAADHRIRAVSPSGDIRTIAGDGSPGLSGDGGPATGARLNSPYGLSLDPQGNLYVADLGNARIRVINTDGRIRTVAGGGDIPASESSEGSPANVLKLQSPRNVLADSSGGFYFSDFDAHRVYFVDYRGTLTVFAGTGTPGYGPDDLAAPRSALRGPAGLAFEPLGGLVIADSGNHRLRRVARGIMTSYLADALRNYPLYSPTGLAFDASGNLYIADSRATGALKRTPQGIVTSLALSGRAVAADPRGGAVYANGNQVLRADPANKVSPLAGSAVDFTGDGGPALTARLLAPSGVVYDNLGNLYIADERAHRVRRVSPTGLISTVAGTGKPAYSGDGGYANRAALNTPRGLAFDTFGNLYIADSGNHAIRVVTPDGGINTLAGNGNAGYRGDGGPATAAQFNSPSGLALTAAGDLYIADTLNHRIRRIGRGGLLTTVAGTGAPGLEYDGANALLAQLNEPRAVALDANGNLYIADAANNRIRRVDSTGQLTTLDLPALTAPRSVTAGSDGRIYIADTGRHRILQLPGKTVAGNEIPGYSGDSGPAAGAQFASPAALAFDNDGNLAVADLGNGRIRQLRPVAALSDAVQSAPVRLVNAASGLDSPLVPGMLASLLGEGIGPADSVEAGAPWPTQLAGTEVLINGESAPVLYASARQINILIPQVTGIENLVEIRLNGDRRAAASFPVALSSPGLFNKIVNEDGSPNSTTNPASRGSVVSLFVTGTGPAGGVSFDVLCDDRPAPVVAFAAMPGFTRVDVRLPSGFFPPGPHQVRLKTNGNWTQDGVSVYLQ